MPTLDELERGVYSGIAAINVATQFAHPDDPRSQRRLKRKIYAKLTAAGITAGAVTWQTLKKTYKGINYLINKATPEQGKRLRQPDSLSISPDKAQVETKEPKRRQVNRQLDMSNKRLREDEDESEDVMMLSASSGSTNARTGQKETRISYHKPSYLLQDTHTTIIPLNIYFSCVVENNEAQDLCIRMNSYRYVLSEDTLIVTRGNDASTNWGPRFTKGLFNNQIRVNPQKYLSCNPVADSVVPSNSVTVAVPQVVSTVASHNITNNDTATATIGSTTITTPTHNIVLPANDGRFNYYKGERPNETRWTQNERNFPDKLESGQQPIATAAAWWEKVYDYYAVLNCDWDLTIQPCSYMDNSDIMVGYGIDVYNSSRSAARYPLQSQYSDAQYWKNVQWRVIETPSESNPEMRFQKISGSYKPGTANRLVVNDEDTKTWTSTAADINPTLLEDLHFMFYASPFNTVHNSWTVDYNDAATTTEASKLQTRFNACLSLKYLVQYKDLKPSFRYPNKGDSTEIALNYPADFTRGQFTEQ